MRPGKRYPARQPPCGVPFQKGICQKGVFAEIGHAFFRVFLILFVQSFLGGPDGFIHAYAKIMGCHLNGILAEQGGLFQAAGVDEQGESPEKVFTCVNGTVSGAGFHLPVETGMIF